MIAGNQASRIAVLALVLVAAACGAQVGSLLGGGGPGSPTLAASLPEIAGVVAEPVQGGQHVDGPIEYAVLPPSGGDHNPVWQTCGFYREPVVDVHAVHSLEHGAVWVAYRGGDDAVAAAAAALAARRQGRVLAAPNPAVQGQDAVLVAWGHRLVLDDITDPRAAAFVDAYVDGDAPEPGASCADGVGTPVG